MSENVFQEYAKYYDIIYADKDYERECRFLEDIFSKFSSEKPKTILDVGCGTGGHAIPLAKRGYEVTGIDASDAMINIAREKAMRNGVSIDFRTITLQKLSLDKKFDVCIAMFAVMDYLTETKDIQKALFNIRNHLEKDSLFVFDFWYGPAVLTILPSQRMKIAEKHGIRVIRFVTPKLNTLRHICEDDYYLTILKGNLIVNEVQEKHIVRFFFPEEIKHYLEEYGFKVLKLCPFLDLNNMPNEKTFVAFLVKRDVAYPWTSNTLILSRSSKSRTNGTESFIESR